MEWQVGKKKAGGVFICKRGKGIRTDAGWTCFSTMLPEDFCKASQNKSPGLRHPLTHPGIIISQRGYG